MSNEETKTKLECLQLKRDQLAAAITEGRIADPITILIAVGVSAAFSVASYAINYALSPKQKPQRVGELTGNIQLQNSEQGIFIPEIYGAGPTASLVAGSTASFTNLTNVSVGGGGSVSKNAGANNTYNAGARHNVALASGDEAFIEVLIASGWAAVGFYTASSPTGSGGDPGLFTGVQWGPDGSLWWAVNGSREPFSTYVAGDKIRVTFKAGVFHVYKNSAELTGFPPATATYPLYMGVTCYTTGAGVSSTKVQINGIGDAPNYGIGGCIVPAIIPWVNSEGIRKVETTVTQKTGGGKGHSSTETVKQVSYNLDIALEWAGNGPYDLLRLYANTDILLNQDPQLDLASGVYNSAIAADSNYTNATLPNAQNYYLSPYTRQNDTLDPLDGGNPVDGGSGGTVMGGSAGFATYPGSATQLPDPTIEADIDAKFGTNSTPAFRNKAYTVLNTLKLDKWNGLVPNMRGVLQHRTLKTLQAIFDSFCSRESMVGGTYDFSGLSSVNVRGLKLEGQRYSPAAVMDSAELQAMFNYFTTEGEGKLLAFVNGNEPTITIPESDFGWIDGEAEEQDIVSTIQVTLEKKSAHVKQVDVKYVDPGADWDANLQSAFRRIAGSSEIKAIEVSVTALPDEARAAALRILYQEDIFKTSYKFTLPWSYAYLYPGYKITTTLAEGFTYVFRLNSISGGIGLLDCEASALEIESYTQPATGAVPPTYNPGQQIPAMSVGIMLDCPLLRDSDNDVNNGVGFYFAATPRTGINHNWDGCVLYQNRNNVYQVIANTVKRATTGTVVSVTGLNTTDPSVYDRVGVIVVDLYGTDAFLSSVTEADINADDKLNLALVGDMICQFVSAVQDPSFPNRWTLTTLLSGKRGTEHNISTIAAGSQFVMVDDAVVFVPLKITDLNNSLLYKAVTFGQSLNDAAVITFAWTGHSLLPLSPVNLHGVRDSQGNLLIMWTRRSRLQAGLISGSDVPLAEQDEAYTAEILTSGFVSKRVMNVNVGVGKAVTLIGNIYPAAILGNSLRSAPPAEFEALAYGLPEIQESGSWVEATLNGNDGFATLGIVESRIKERLGRNSGQANSFYYIQVSLSKNTAFAGSGGKTGLQIECMGAVVYNSDSIGTGLARIRILLSGTEVRFYWDYMGPGSVPFYTSPTLPVFPVVPYAITVDGVASDTEVRNMNSLGATATSTIYSAAQQVKDFGSLQNPIKVRVRQISAVVGPGDYVEADL